MAKDLFSPLCIGLSCFRAFVCFMGFLIKTHEACVVYDIEGSVGGGGLSHRQCSGWPRTPFLGVIDSSRYFLLLEMFIFTLLPHSDLFFCTYLHINYGVLAFTINASVSHLPGVLTKMSIHI